MRKLFLIVLFILGFSTQSFAEADVEFILDVSGSMVEKLNGAAQIDLAKKAVLDSLAEINPKQLVALRVYGHRIDKSQKEESCKDTELLIPFKQLDAKEFNTKVSSLSPKGWTPIAYSLQESRNDLLDVGLGREVERVIILMTDGEETCGGNPLEVLKKLKDEGFKLKVHTVGFNVNEVARKQLKEIADFTGGKYFDAKNAEQLKKSFKEATKETAQLLEKTKVSYGTEIRGGDSYEKAVPLELDKEYKLDHHQKLHDYDYFYLDLKKAERLNITLKTREKGVDIEDDGSIRETNHPYAGLELHAPSYDKQKDINIIGGAHKTETIAYSPKETGRYYILLGSVYEPMNKDHMSFIVSVERKGDLGTTNDAGDTIDSAMPVEIKRYEKNYLGENDDLDIFSFQAKAADVYLFGVIPNSKASRHIDLRVYNEFKESLFSGSSAVDSGIKSTDVKISEDGTYYVEVGYDDEAPVEYSLILKKKAVEETSSKTEPTTEEQQPKEGQ